MTNSSCFFFFHHHEKLVHYTFSLHLSQQKFSLFIDFLVFTIAYYVRVNLVLIFANNRNRKFNFLFKIFHHFCYLCCSLNQVTTRFFEKNEDFALPCIQREFSRVKSLLRKSILFFIFR